MLKQRGFRAVLPRFYFSPAGEEKQLWCGFAPTLGQTRSGTGDAHALGHDLPLFRTFFDSLVCCPQARLRTFPGNDILGTRGDGLCWIEMGCQKGRIQIALHRPDATGALMKPLRERLFAPLPTAVAILGQLTGTGGDLVQGAAGTCT